MNDIVSILFNRTNELLVNKKVDEAVNSLQQVVCESLNLLSSVEHFRHNTLHAIHLLKFCRKMNPNNWVPYSNISHLFSSIGEYEKSIKWANKAIKLCDSNSDPYFNRAVAAVGLRKIKEGVEYFRKALTISPDNDMINFNLGCCLMILGQVEEGWKLLELRFKCVDKVKEQRARFPKPTWDGQRTDATVVVYCEQGLGDVIQHCRFLPLLKERVGKTVLECQDSLETLLQDSADVIITRTVGQSFKQLPEHEYVVSISSLPYALGLKKADINCKPYISPKGSSTLPEINGDEFNIGICWSGSIIHYLDWGRSIPLRFFKALERPKVKLFAFQKDDQTRMWPDGQIDLLEGSEDMQVVDLSPHIQCVNDIAHALIKMDVVVTVDTMLAHLAGAMGKKTFLLLPTVNDSRWGLDNTTPWYPTMRIFRQQKEGDWETPLKEISNELN